MTTVVLSPDTLKGSLSAVDAASGLADGIREVLPDAHCRTLPLSDGGEGFIDAVRHVLGGRIATSRVRGPLGDPTDARYLVTERGIAVVESAQAIGLTLIPETRLDPLRADSAGLGELLAAVADEPDVTEILLGVGGVATVDGGAGMRTALPTLPVPVHVASDVRNPLLGPRGAAAVFGPQKGATAEHISVLEKRLAALALPAEIVASPGAGAAGGLGAMLLDMGATLGSGIEHVLNLLQWTDFAAAADLVVTGERQIDPSSSEGKVVSGVLAAAKDVPVVVFGGRVMPESADQLRRTGAAAVFSLSGDPARAATDVRDLGRALARLLATGRTRA